LVLLTISHPGGQINNDLIIEACGMYVEKKRHIQNFGGET
jgi:hypothetical protein